MPRWSGATSVYVARGLASGLYKIGCSRNVRDRMRWLRSMYREGIELLAAMPGDLAAEAALLRRFGRLRAFPRYLLSRPPDQRGKEWFRDDGSIAAFVASLPSEHHRHDITPFSAALNATLRAALARARSRRFAGGEA